MGILLEVLLELILEGSLEAVSEKKVPMPLRILAGIIVLAFFLFLFWLFAMIALGLLEEGRMPEAVFVFAIDIGFVLIAVYGMRKKFREKNRSE